MKRVCSTFKSIFISALQRIFFCLALFLFISSTISAKHLVGGSVTYQFIGMSGSFYHFRLTLYAYRDCSNADAPELSTQATFGIYEHTGGTESLYDTITLFRKSLISVDAVSGGPACKDVPYTCLQQGMYSGDINLRSSPYGYDIQYLTCCRNVIVNIPDNSGYNYYGFISPTTYKNTSPSFNDVPVPYICTNDTVIMNFSATEPDGDSITYSLATPYTSGTSGGPNNTYVPLTFTKPNPVSYNSGYSEEFPFGLNGLCVIDVRSGLLTVYATKIGNYVIAVDYNEYRNGKLINTTRRDVQFIVESCSPNPAPVRASINGTAPVDYYITVGQTFDFQLAYMDPNFNPVSFSAQGGIFTRTTNPATVTLIPTGKKSTITANIKWSI